MKQKIAILGSTGSIGRTTLSIISENKNNFSIELLSINKNIVELKKQIKEFNVKNIIINDFETYSKNKSFFNKKKINTFNNFKEFKLNYNKRFDYIMAAISGLDGFESTLESIEITKKIAIANKESIICGWNLIKKRLKKFNTKFIPVDSEHFSIWSLLNNTNSSNQDIKKIYITASGGPFLNYDLNKIYNIKPKQALKHPTWKMGKKISIDSATLMNKVFEVIEAKNIFDIPYNKIEILIHPKSYIHSIIEFKNGLIKVLAHETSMEIPIINSLSEINNIDLSFKNFDFNKLNNLNLSKPDTKKFSSLSILRFLPNKQSIFECVLISANDELVDLFLKKKITFQDVSKKLLKFIQLKEFVKFKKKTPKNIHEIKKISNYVSLKIKSLSV